MQPQWIYDCLNFTVLLPLQQYRPGAELPPHLSPFVEYQEEGFVPDRLKEVLALKGEEVQQKAEIEAEKKEMAKAVMTKKMRKLYTRMQFVLQKKRSAAGRLHQRQAELAE